MGTSTGRRSPSTRFWQSAKRTATKYFATGETGPVSVHELVSDYLAALKDTETLHTRDLLAAFRLTRKVALQLGELADKAALQGWTATLTELGVDLTGESSEIMTAALTAKLLTADHSLEQEVVRTALARVFLPLLPAALYDTQQLAAEGDHPYLPLDTPTLVAHFLATALYHRLVFDLGESLEAAAPAWQNYAQGLAAIQTSVHQAAQAAVQQYPPPRRWSGLSAWTWVTQVLETLLHHFTPPTP